MSNDFDVLIIGAGFSGLIAARELSGKNMKVAIVEAKAYAGGRTHTNCHSAFSVCVETGAEFIHGRLPFTFQLLQEAGISYEKVGGTNWRHKDGQLSANEFFIEGWDVLMDRLQEVEEDMTIKVFLEKFFSESIYDDMRRSVRGFVEGFDAADISLASTKALREEWMNEEESEQYRITGGYGKLIDYLEEACKRSRVEFIYSEPVMQVFWKPGNIEVTTMSGRKITSKKLIITVPLGVLQASKEAGAIIFDPPLLEKSKAIQALGFGAVIKILIEFKEPFWKSLFGKDDNGKDKSMRDLGFLFSDAVIPTWWTQFPDRVPLLTGWVAGPKTAMFKNYTDSEILETALASLAEIFGLQKNEIAQKIHASQVFNWAKDVFSLGAYAYPTLETERMKPLLQVPENDALFFAGEAVYEGSAIGTVEAAISSGYEVARKVINAM